VVVGALFAPTVSTENHKPRNWKSDNGERKPKNGCLMGSMTSHFLLLLVFAFFVSLVFSVLLRDEPREQLRTGAMMFGGFIATAIVLGWLMYPFPL